MASNINEIVSTYGPIVYASEECESLISINGCYLNWWIPTVEKDGNGLTLYKNTNCRSCSLRSYPDLTWHEATKEAERLV
jgi:hypothetical protein